uniref:Calcineurin-like phosphoesterase domain-containing protein n=1 Tax=Panagrolaimus davidi TaxID=227884 RepID=A0A914QGX8_9BILA
MLKKLIKMRKILIPFLPLIFAFIFNEYFIYHFVIGRCSWPKMSTTKNHESEYTNVMILADTHLLGVKNGHWFDKLRREWQMRRSFQTAISWLSPDAVFFLGDLFDEGQWADDQQFDIYATRFDALFHVPETIKRFVAVGNHDIGFHYALMPHHLDRFSRRFNIDPTVGYVNIGGNHFIVINSMALEKDGCKLCHQAEETIKELKEKFDCAFSQDCEEKLPGGYSRPIIMQHFPLYRKNDEVCEFENDLAPPSLRSEPFREKWECISQESTDFLVKSLRPRAAFGGHSHFTCSKFWEAPYNFWEYTISSFSWRNNRWPSFLLLKVSPQELKVQKCHLPHEHTVIWIYALATLLSISVLFIQFFLWSKTRTFSFKRISTKIS